MFTIPEDGGNGNSGWSIFGFDIVGFSFTPGFELLILWFKSIILYLFLTNSIVMISSVSVEESVCEDVVSLFSFLFKSIILFLVL